MILGANAPFFMWKHRHRRGMRGRIPKPIMLGASPPIGSFMPNPLRNPTPVFLEAAEIEALRLVDLEGLSQEEAGQRMGVSRGTVWRLVKRARKKVAQALTEGSPIHIVPSIPESSQP